MKGWGQAFQFLPASHTGVSGPRGLLSPLPSLGGPGIIHIFMNGKHPLLYLAAAWSQRAGGALLVDFKGLEQACLVMFTAQHFAGEAKKAPSGSFLKTDGLSKQPQ